MNGTTNELDQLAKAVACGGGITDEEAERIGSSPFLHTRIRAGIEAEQRRAQQGSGWLATVLVASRAIAALLLVTVATASAFWITRTSKYQRAADTLAPVISKADDLNRVVIGGTCALSSTDKCAISTEEVLATMFASERGNADERKEEK